MRNIFIEQQLFLHGTNADGKSSSVTKATLNNRTKRDIVSYHINSSLLQEIENLLFFFQEFMTRNRVRRQLCYLFIHFSTKTYNTI